MASSTKPGLSAVVTPALTDIVSVRQSGDTRDKRETLTQIKTLMPGGDVVGPASATDGAFVAFDGTTGRLVKQAGTAPLLTGAAAGGDLSGTYPNPTVVDDSHAHTAATVTGVLKASGAIDNAALRADGTGGATSQGSALIISDVAAGVLSLSAEDGVTAVLDVAISPKSTGKFRTTAVLFQIGGTSSAFPMLKAPGSSGILSFRKADDSGYAITNAERFRAWTGESSATCTLNGDMGVEVARDFAIGFSGTASDATQTKDTYISRPAAGIVGIDGATKGDAKGLVKAGAVGAGAALQFLKRTSTAAAATTTEYPNDGDVGIHKNTNTGAHHLVMNDGGTLFTVQLT